MERQSAKKKGMFSRRYQTAGAYLKSKEIKLARIDEQFRASARRESERKQRTPQQQIEKLNERLGEGIGAKRERVRLHQQIADAKAPKKQADSDKPKKNRKSRKQRQRS